MFIAIVDLHTAPADRPIALERLESERPTVAAMPGCIAIRVFAAPDNDTELTLLEEWEDEEAFRAYLDSESFAASGQVLRPLMTEPPASRRFRAELVETVA